jgi:hypothetical protein
MYILLKRYCTRNVESSIAKPYNFNAAPALGKNFDAAPAQAVLAQAPNLLCNKPTFFKSTKVNIRFGIESL